LSEKAREDRSCTLSVGIWSARDADQLAEALQSLPIWPLITLEVTPMATHPLFAEMAREGQG
jgi:muconolactone delta-isomerase